MAGSVNKVILLGHVGKEPEIRSTQSGARFASFSLATSESWKDKATGERKEKTEWTNVSISNEALVSVVERYVKKGSKLYVEGKLETRKWTDSNGVDKYSTEVVLRPYGGELTILDSKETVDKPNSAYNTSTQAQSPNAFSSDLDDSEVPF